MLELRNPVGQLSFDHITPEIIGTLTDDQAKSLSALIEAHKAHEAAIARRNAAVKRVADATANEQKTLAAHEDASSPIPFSVTAIEQQLGRPLDAAEMAAARSAHSQRVLELKSLQARQASIDSYNSEISK
jgi:hypothetical protein